MCYFSLKFGMEEARLLPTKEVTARDRLDELLDNEYMIEYNVGIWSFRGYQGLILSLQPADNAIRYYRDRVEVMLDNMVGELYDDRKKYMVRFTVERDWVGYYEVIFVFAHRAGGTNATTSWQKPKQFKFRHYGAKRNKNEH